MSKEQNEIPFWKMTAEQLYKHYNTTPEGYSDKQVEELHKVYPLNELEEKEDESI